MKRQYDDDLFKDSTMTFGEHIEELRTCLYRAIVGLALGTAVGMYFGDHIVELIKAPLEKALEEYDLDRSKAELEAKYGDRLRPEQLANVVERQLVFEEVLIEPSSVLESLAESSPGLFAGPTPSPLQLTAEDILEPAQLAGQLRGTEDEPSAARRVWGLLTEAERKAIQDQGAEESAEESAPAIAAALDRLLGEQGLFETAAFADVSLATATRELLERRSELSRDELRRLNWTLLSAAWPDAIATPHNRLVSMFLWRQSDKENRIKTLNPTEAFMIWMKASLLFGCVLASPWIFYQMWSFVAAGLYPHEKKYVHVFLPFSVGLFLSGVVLAFVFVFPPVLHFLFKFNAGLGIDPDPRISEWLHFVLFMPLGFGVSFQLPLVMLFLERIGIFTIQSYWSKWRVAVLVIFVLAAVLTPSPDPYSMLLLAGPLTGLYFGGIALCKFAARRSAARPRGITADSGESTVPVP